MGLRQTHDAGRAPAQAPAVPRKDAEGTGPRAGKTGEPGEEIDTGDKEKCKEWANGSMQGPGQGPGEDETVY